MQSRLWWGERVVTRGFHRGCSAGGAAFGRKLRGKWEGSARLWAKCVRARTERSGWSVSSSSSIEWNSPPNATTSRPRSLTSSKTDFRRLSWAIFPRKNGLYKDYNSLGSCITLIEEWWVEETRNLSEKSPMVEGELAVATGWQRSVGTR